MKNMRMFAVCLRILHDIDVLNSYVDALGYGIDGNYRPGMRKKPRDKNDKSLYGASAYSTHQGDFAKHLEKAGEIEEEVNHQIATKLNIH